jgi:hypothetical protein
MLVYHIALVVVQVSITILYAQLLHYEKEQVCQNYQVSTRTPEADISLTDHIRNGNYRTLSQKRQSVLPRPTHKNSGGLVIPKRCHPQRTKIDKTTSSDGIRAGSDRIGTDAACIT